MLTLWRMLSFLVYLILGLFGVYYVYVYIVELFFILFIRKKLYIYVILLVRVIRSS